MKGGFSMRKLITIILILTILFIISNNSSKEVMIPKESIRFRVVANSNSNKDQKNKKLIANNLKNDVTDILASSNNINESRIALKSNIDKFKLNIDKTIKENNINESYTINYGNNYFPEKKYKNVNYPEGEYESLVITLGDGAGENFWCVLFPPLCLLENNGMEEVEYRSFVADFVKKYF